MYKLTDGKVIEIYTIYCIVHKNLESKLFCSAYLEASYGTSYLRFPTNTLRINQGPYGLFVPHSNSKHYIQV